MHSSTTQILAQRALPATRSKPRWQPYNSIPSASSGSISTPRSPTMNIPNPVASPHPTQASLQPPALRSSVLAPSIQPPKDLSQRDPNKHKFAAGLIDQAVNTLSEIWRPQDIPKVFQTPSKGSNLLATTSTHIIPPTTPPSTSRTPLTSTLSSVELTSPPTAAADPDHSLLPMKSFVHEVLRRSRTSASILQAALCYLEAVRLKVPEILKQEQMGIRAHYLPDSTILPATEAELEQEAELAAVEQNMECDDLPKTIRVTDIDAQCFDVPSLSGQEDEDSLSSLIAEASVSSSIHVPSLPSPLLCPRRTFLASLILASKFFQDKCYSNRAWAKLSGLPPREIGRCERALGQALEWRLWVGKTSTTPQSTSTSAAPTPIRKVIRSQSEASLFMPPSSTQQFLVQEGGPTSHTGEAPQVKQKPACHSRAGLRRCSTMPNDVFSSQPPDLYDASASTTQAAGLDQDMVRSSKGVTQDEAELLAPSSFTVKRALSPRPPTPPLTYSPSSTESSMGDHTAQMPSFEDNMFPSYDGTQSWPDGSRSHSAVKIASPISLVGTYTYVDGELVLGLVGMPTNASGVSIVDPSGGSYGRYLWQEESHYRHVEPAGVH